MPDFLQLDPTFDVGPAFWALAMFASFIIGVSKSGVKGIAIISVTSLALVFGSKASTGIVVPLLIVADIIAVVYYRKHVRWKYLFKLLPWMALGVIAGTIVGDNLSEAAFKKGMAMIILFSVVTMVWWERKKEVKIPEHWTFAGGMGLAAGFTTMIGNLAGAFSNLFFLAMRLPKNEFIGTAAWLFFFINLFKLPFHIFAWETISMATLSVNLRLIPTMFLGFWVGKGIVSLIPEAVFRKMILVLTALGALILLLR